MFQNVLDRVMTGVVQKAADVQASASKNQEPLHTQAYANRAHSAGECKTRTAQKAHVEAARNQAKSVVESSADQSEVMKRDVLGNLLVVVQDNRDPGDWAIRACLKYMNSSNSMTKGLALLTHSRLLQLMPPEKRSSELLAAVQCVATSLCSIDEIDVQFGLKYIAACWDGDLVSSILGSPGKPYRTAGPHKQESVTIFNILLPDEKQPKKPSLTSPNTVKHALVALISLLQRFGTHVEEAVDVVSSTKAICARNLSHPTLCLPTCNLLYVVVSRAHGAGRVADCRAALLPIITTAIAHTRERLRMPSGLHMVHMLHVLVRTLALLCVDGVDQDSAAGFGAAMDWAKHGTTSMDDHEMSVSVGLLAQVVCAVASLPVGSQRVAELQKKATDATTHIFRQAHNMTPAQWRNPNNLRFEALRCVIALQATNAAVAVPMREYIVSCLRAPDASLRHLAADVLFNSCNSDNLTGVVEQFLLIINSATEDSVKAMFADRVARLVEAYAAPAEYARSMASVLAAAGNAADSRLAGCIAGTLTTCGDTAVQQETASVFLKLLKGASSSSLSDVQMMTGLWVVSEYGPSVASVQEVVGSIVGLANALRLPVKLQVAVLMAVHKVVSHADAAQAAELAATLDPFLRKRAMARESMVSRMAYMTMEVLSKPNMFASVSFPDTSTVASESDITLPALEQLSAQHSSAGKRAYEPPEEREDGLFARSLAPPQQPTLRMEHYQSPATMSPEPPAAAKPTAAVADPAPTVLLPSGQQRKKPAPAPPRLGTFSNIISPGAGAQAPAAAAAGDPGGSASGPAGRTAFEVARNSKAADILALGQHSEQSALEDALFGGPKVVASSAAAGARPAAAGNQTAHAAPSAAAAQPPPLLDLLGDGGGGGALPVASAAAEVQERSPLGDLLADSELPAAAPAGAESVPQSGGGLDLMDLGQAAPPVATAGDPFAVDAGAGGSVGGVAGLGDEGVLGTMVDMLMQQEAVNSGAGQLNTGVDLGPGSMRWAVSGQGPALPVAVTGAPHGLGGARPPLDNGGGPKTVFAVGPPAGPADAPAKDKPASKQLRGGDKPKQDAFADLLNF